MTSPFQFMPRRGLVGALFAAGLLALPLGGAPLGRVHAQTATTGTATRIHLIDVGTVIPAALPVAATSSTPPHSIPLRLPPGVRGRASATIHSGPLASSVPTTRFQLTSNFDGINEIINNAVSKTPLEPPDEGLGVAPGFIFNLVNVTGAFYRPNGTLYRPPFPANAFFHEPASAFTSDPRTYYDASTHTWFATILEGDFTKYKESHLDLAVNHSSSPLTPWKVYRIDTTDSQDNGCPCFGDYPEFGIDQYNVYITTNEFPLDPTIPLYNGAQIYAISKSQLEALAPSPNVVHFSGFTAGGTYTYHVQPAISYTNPPAEYFMEALDPNGFFDYRLVVFALTNREAVTTGAGMPYLSSTVIQSEPYGFPLPAVTPPGYNGYTHQATTGLISPDFDAMQEVEYINGHLDGALNSAVTIPGDTYERDGVAWFQVAPYLSGDVIGSGTHVSHQGYLSSQGNYLLYPHINENAGGAIAMVFTLGGPFTYLSAAYAVKPAGQEQFDSVHLAAGGVTSDNGFTDTSAFGGVGRWGDYSNGEVDPWGNFWLATQYIPNSGDKFANWGNRIFQIHG